MIDFLSYGSLFNGIKHYVYEKPLLVSIQVLVFESFSLFLQFIEATINWNEGLGTRRPRHLSTFTSALARFDLKSVRHNLEKFIDREKYVLENQKILARNSRVHERLKLGKKERTDKLLQSHNITLSSKINIQSSQLCLFLRCRRYLKTSSYRSMVVNFNPLSQF